MPSAFVNQGENSDPSGSSQTSFATPSTGTGSIGASTTGNLQWWAVYYVAGANVAVTGANVAGNTSVTVAQFYNSTNGDGMAVGYIKNISGSATEVFTANFASGVTFPAVYCQEDSGLDTVSPFLVNLVAGQQAAPGTGTDALTTSLSGALSTQPCRLVGISFNETSSGVPAAGTGFTPRTTIWNYGSPPGVGEAALPEDKRLTSLASVALTATASVGADTYYTVAMIFKEAGAATPVEDDGDYFQFVQAA